MFHVLIAVQTLAALHSPQAGKPANRQSDAGQKEDQAAEVEISKQAEVLGKLMDLLGVAKAEQVCPFLVFLNLCVAI